MRRLRFDFPPSLQPGPAVYTDPVRVVRAYTPAEVVPALYEIDLAARQGWLAAGYVAYEAAAGLEPAVAVRGGTDLPLLEFGLFEEPQSYPGPGSLVEDPDESSAIDWTLEMGRPEHAAAVDAIREAIAEGRTYQVNLTTRMTGQFDGDPEALYHRLRRAQGPGFHALLDLGRHVIVSASPELFFRTRGREIVTRPMKGTRPRGRWPEEDRRLAQALATSPKDRAENLMIVDLLRNDLGRVCVPGGVHVPTLWEVERYRTVWQMTSTVTGRLRDGTALVDLFRALFPCGSVTGAPKISTMEVIAGLEPAPRGVYCGAIGWVGPGGDCVFSVPIRTAWIDREARRITYGTGGGVVWDSTPEGEYDELLAKTRVIRDPWPAFRLLETLGIRDGLAVRLDRHLGRMAAAAERFDFPFPEAAIRGRVADAVAEATRQSLPAARLRITLGPDGDVATRIDSLDFSGAPGPGAWRGPGSADGTPRVVVLAAAPVDSRDPFLFHKTTHRALYDRALAAAPSEAFDVLLWNEEGMATEFCTGNLVADLDGALLTPPLEAGLLPGCLRAELLEEGRISEAALSVDDLGRAPRVWLINSLRGWVPVRLPTRG